MRGAAGDGQIHHELRMDKTIKRMLTCSEGGSPYAKGAAGKSRCRQITRGNG